MALTKISDIIEPAVYLSYQKEFTPEKLDILSSAAVGSLPPDLASQMTAGGSVIDVPFWQDTDRAEPNAQTDDESVSAVPKKIVASKQTARKLYWHQSWSQVDLAGAFATGNTKDPLRQISDFTERYWRRVTQLTLVQMLNGILADNVANDSADMRYLIYSDIVTPLAANKISPAAVNRARLTMGEFLDELSVIIMHSKVYGDALDQENITFVQPSKLPFKIAMFAGMQVIISDDATVVAGANSPKYRSYLFGPNALAYAMHYPETAVETFRNPEKGNGAGVETLHNRRHVMFHPQGFRFTSASVAGKSPTWAELATATNWDRKYQRKNIKIGFLETN